MTSLSTAASERRHGVSIRGIFVFLSLVVMACSEAAPSRSSVLDASTPMSAPVFQVLNLDTTTVSPGDRIEVTAVVSDPDGAADVLGGRITRVGSGAQVAVFRAISAGAFTATLTWDQLNAEETVVTGPEGARRTYLVTFVDNVGLEVHREIEILLTCAISGQGLCDGACTRLDTIENCVTCGNVCSANEFAVASCESTGCVETCRPDAFRCDDGCTAFEYEDVSTIEGTPVGAGFDERGNIFVVSKRSGNLRIHQRQGTAWNDSYIARSGWTAMTRSGEPHFLSIDGFIDAPNDLVYIHPSTDGWTRSVLLSDNEDRGSPSIAVDKDGAPHIIFVAEGPSLKYAYRDDAGQWVYESIEASGGIVFYSGTIALTSDGRPSVVAKHSLGVSSGELYYLERTGPNAWSTSFVTTFSETPPSIGVGRVPVTAEIDAPIIVVLSDDGTVSTATPSSTAWRMEPIFSDPNLRSLTAPLVDRTGTVHLLATSNDRGTYLRLHGDQIDMFELSLPAEAWSVFTVDAEGEVSIFFDRSRSNPGISRASLRCVGARRE